MACSESGHGASDCKDKAKQLEYFIRRLTPTVRNQFGSNPVYGGSADSLLGEKFSRLKQAKQGEKLRSVAQALQQSAIKLRKGSLQLEQEIVYPNQREH